MEKLWALFESERPEFGVGPRTVDEKNKLSSDIIRLSVRCLHHTQFHRNDPICTGNWCSVAGGERPVPARPSAKIYDKSEMHGQKKGVNAAACGYSSAVEQTQAPVHDRLDAWSSTAHSKAQGYSTQVHVKYGYGSLTRTVPGKPQNP